MSEVRHSALRAARWMIIALPLSLLAACGGVQIKPEPALPEPLIKPLPAAVGVVIPEEARNFVHKETRWGVNWQIDLGAGHVRMIDHVFGAAFDQFVSLKDRDAARQTEGLKAIFEPLIEQYAFVTARETGGRYYAVTIRYRINLYTPDAAELVDSYTLTGYGNALAKGLSSSGPLQQASIAAMRDAAAKFLVQFPEQPPAKLLAQNRPVVVEKSAQSDGGGEIEAVPIYEKDPAQTSERSTMPPLPAGQSVPIPRS